MYCKYCGEPGIHYCEKTKQVLDADDIQLKKSGPSEGDVLVSAVVAHTTHSAILGAVVGGSLVGGLLGSMLGDD